MAGRRFGDIETLRAETSARSSEWAFAEAGLRDLRWHAPRVSPDGVAQSGSDFWADLLDAKPVICLESGM